MYYFIFYFKKYLIKFDKENEEIKSTKNKIK